MSRKTNFMNKIPMRQVPRNLFDLSHEVKMSGKFGYLYPVLCMETMPGDTIRDTMTAFVRMAPMIAPVMHRVDVKTDFFFVPMRLITDHWQNFITGGQDGQQAPVLPFFTVASVVAASSVANIQKGSLWDYLGLPTHETGGSDNTEPINCLPFRAYAKIYNDWFRDPNIDPELDLSTQVQGALVTVQINPIISLRFRGWERDMFTSALPWAQRGTQVLMPLAGNATVTFPEPLQDSWQQYDGGLPAAGNVQININRNMVDSTGEGIVPTGVTAQISSSGVSINDFRLSVALQNWLEASARGGGRYIEQIQAHYGVRTSDYRLQRSEYLGGGRQPMRISEVVGTNGASGGDLGELGGHGASVGKSNRFTYRCEEHGYVIGIMSVVPRTAYQQGMHRMFTRASRFDYAFPSLANLGEQEIKTKELMFNFNVGGITNNNTTFGYIPRYAEYKIINDRVAGDFKTTLLHWHLGRKFTGQPTLSTGFMQMVENPATEVSYRRIFAVADGTDYLWCQLWHQLSAKRPLPYFGVPQLKG